MVILGASYQVTDRFLAAMDLQWTNWASAWDSQTTYLEGKGILGYTELTTTFNYDDTLSLRIGAEYRLWRNLFCQAGYWWDPTPIPDRTAAGNAMDADKHVFSVGLGYRGLFNGTLDISCVFQYFLVPMRRIETNTSINLEGLKKFVPSGTVLNDFPSEFGGYALNVGVLLGIHF
jgi:long-chain fatty acid transport protein